MAGLGRPVAAGLAAHGWFALANPVADECSRNAACAGAGFGFHADESEWTGGFAGGSAGPCVGGGHYFHEMCRSMSENDAANERVGEGFAGGERHQTCDTDDGSGL